MEKEKTKTTRKPKPCYRDCNVQRFIDGGVRQSDVKREATAAGIEVKFGPSCYVGMYGVFVRTEDKRKLRRLERICYGR